jgi:hypothetical protein
MWDDITKSCVDCSSASKDKFYHAPTGKCEPCKLKTADCEECDHATGVCSKCNSAYTLSADDRKICSCATNELDSGSKCFSNTALKSDCGSYYPEDDSSCGECGCSSC